MSIISSHIASAKVQMRHENDKTHKYHA